MFFFIDHDPLIMITSHGIDTHDYDGFDYHNQKVINFDDCDYFECEWKFFCFFPVVPSHMDGNHELKVIIRLQSKQRDHIFCDGYDHIIMHVVVGSY